MTMILLTSLYGVEITFKWRIHSIITEIKVSLSVPSGLNTDERPEKIKLQTNAFKWYLTSRITITRKPV